MSDIKDRMGSLRAELVVDDVYKQFYKFIFTWARGALYSVFFKF
jgi:hypothetical protein